MGRKEGSKERKENNNEQIDRGKEEEKLEESRRRREGSANRRLPVRQVLSNVYLSLVLRGTRGEGPR